MVTLKFPKKAPEKIKPIKRGRPIWSLCLNKKKEEGICKSYSSSTDSRGGDDGDARTDGVHWYHEQDAEDVLLRPREVVIVRVQQHVSAAEGQRQHLHHPSQPIKSIVG